MINSQENLTVDQILKLIFGYASKIANERKMDNILMLIADMGRDLIQSDRCTMWMYDREYNELWTKVAHGVGTIRVPANAGIVGYTITTGKSFFTNDAYNEELFNKEVDKQTGYRTQSNMCIPLFSSSGEVIGALQAVNKMTESKCFTDKDLEYFGIAATYASKSLEAAILNDEIEKTQKEIIFLMAEVGESRSKETGNHVKRVAEYSKLLALKAGMTENEAELIKVASPMHDIGKVGIPDEILKKPGKLTPEEFEVMKSHTSMGYSILKNSGREIVRASSIIAHQHHEKWNGLGYPQQLKGDQIHIYGRISAIADVFDALGSDRCYKKAWELDRIVNMFIEEKGQQFDPLLTQVFLDNLDDFVVIRDSYKDEFECT
ncbi:MAG: HD domain-containing phosphohydrolase [Bacillota bacterium]